MMLALTHVPSPNLSRCQLTYVSAAPIDLGRAASQHAAYCQALRDCGASVRVLDCNRDEPDGVFIEDAAVVLDEVAVLGSMGTPARRAEVAGVAHVLREYCRELRRIEPPATLEGGDVLRVGRRLLVGLSCRTNEAGIAAFDETVRPFGYTVEAVPVRGCLHLKTACTALDERTLIVNPAWLDVNDLRPGFRHIAVPESEPWAANVLPIGGAILLAAGQDRTAEMIHRRGFDARSVDISEFAKAEGGVTCLSIVMEMQNAE